MTTQEKLTKIESVIRDACPELTIPPDVSYLWGNTITTPTLVRKNEDGAWETVGDKIRMEHILRAIEAKEYNKHTMLTITGYIMNYHDDYPAENTGIKYDLTKPYHLQSDEFISWLYGVLCE